jgi:hypothetical protein
MLFLLVNLTQSKIRAVIEEKSGLTVIRQPPIPGAVRNEDEKFDFFSRSGGRQIVFPS